MYFFCLRTNKLRFWEVWCYTVYVTRYAFMAEKKSIKNNRNHPKPTEFSRNNIICLDLEIFRLAKHQNKKCSSRTHCAKKNRKWRVHTLLSACASRKLSVPANEMADLVNVSVSTQLKSCGSSLRMAACEVIKGDLLKAIDSHLRLDHQLNPRLGDVTTTNPHISFWILFSGWRTGGRRCLLVLSRFSFLSSSVKCLRVLL